MPTSAPQLHVLPSSQYRVWERLGATPKEIILYGGTALALRLGHRTSVDFDFFSHVDFLPAELLNTITYLKDQEVVQESANTLSCNVDAGAGPVKVSFSGGRKDRRPVQ